VVSSQAEWGFLCSAWAALLMPEGAQLMAVEGEGLLLCTRSVALAKHCLMIWWGSSLLGPCVIESGHCTTTGAGVGEDCEITWVNLAQAEKELKIGGPVRCSPRLRSVSNVVALFCPRAFLPFRSEPLDPLLANVPLPIQLRDMCPLCLHAKHLMEDLHISLVWSGSRQREQIPACRVYEGFFAGAFQELVGL
jgi:hypothetical protein